MGWVSVDLADKLDFSTDSIISVKVWSPTFGQTLRIKLEDKNDNSIFVEKDVAIPVGFNWVEVEVGFSTAAAGTYDKLVLFPGWNVANAGTFYLDDIKQK